MIYGCVENVKLTPFDKMVTSQRLEYTSDMKGVQVDMIVE